MTTSSRAASRSTCFSVIPRMYGGVTSADELIRIGEVAKKHAVRMVKVTGGQRIDLLGITKDKLPEVWRDLGMPSGYAYTKAFRTCKTCVGSEFCRYGTNDSTTLGIAIEKRFQGFEFPAKVKMAVSGCPRNCAESTVKDVGVVATEGGECFGALDARVRAACDELAERIGGEDIVVVSHVSPIKAAVAWALGIGDEVAWRMWVGPASITRIGVGRDGRPSLRGFNDVAHLA